MKLEIFKKIKIPDKHGVYFFFRGKEIIYIGKATSLRSRVRSYFGKDLIGTRGLLLVDMVFHANKIDWQATDSVLEALILEAALIKKYQPKYNTKEKDDKSFSYVVITKGDKEQLPQVLILRGKDLKEKQKNFTLFSLPRVRGKTHTNQNFSVSPLNVFGPFTNGNQLREAMKIVRRIFPYLDEKSKNSYEFYRQVELVPDITNPLGIKKYKSDLKNIKLFFQAKKKRILTNLEKEMRAYAKVQQFEKAGVVKNQIFALKHINDVALIKEDNINPSILIGKDPKVFRIEAYDIAHMSGKNMVGVMTVVENNNVIKSEYKKFKIRTQSNANDTGALVEVLKRRLAHLEWQYPSLIVVDGGIAQLNAGNKTLKALSVAIPVVSVVKDARHKPKAIMGKDAMIKDHKRAILLANSESHRFAIAYHKNMRNRNFLKK